MAFSIADRRCQSADRVDPLAPVDGVAALADAGEFIQQFGLVALRTVGMTFDARRDALGASLRQEGEDRLASCYAVGRSSPSDIGAGTDLARAVDLVDVDRIAAVIDRNGRCLSGLCSDLLHRQARRAYELGASECACSQLPELERHSVRAAFMDLLDIVLVDQRAQELMGVALDQARTLGDLRQAI